MTAYYNENDKNAAQWLRNLSAAGLICPGAVDDRDIRDVTANDIKGYTQHHFFAGIGIWSLALRMAGWPDDRPVTTGSCPCQPFSGAGKGDGFDDERHLWPAWHWLISQYRPNTIFGEQVESKDGRAWLDLVSADLESLAYAFAPVVLPVASLGAPNIRHRFFWVADASGARRRKDARKAFGDEEAHGGEGWDAFEQNGDNLVVRDCSDGATIGLADANYKGESGRRISRPNESFGTGVGTSRERSTGLRATGWMANSGGQRCSEGLPDHAETGHDLFGGGGEHGGGQGQPHAEQQDPWRELEWIDCLDGKRRPAQSTLQRMVAGNPADLGYVRSNREGEEERLMLFPLCQRRPGDVAKLRAYGNAISPVVAAEFIKAYLGCRQ